MERNALKGTLLFALRGLMISAMSFLVLRDHGSLRLRKKDKKPRPRDQQQCWVGDPGGTQQKEIRSQVTNDVQPKTLLTTCGKSAIKENQFCYHLLCTNVRLAHGNADRCTRYALP